ncbi:hypothetical protein PBI_THONKO_32 [Mycobacterium phage Thonko]|uniref:Uncharacterized protein n=1 Tax=Mycobacterium phage Thonko TaxID=2282910 RepID=A0A346FC79_9CAUD|nr:hypothetical protein I5G57_gp032 [Mycobacterium phage Thonko]AXN53304.1 hypothetical protein PBI_THONKO_32 [Mycobacterium phage Thonko]
MATGISAYLANKLLDEVCRNVNYVPPAVVYFQAHTGDPGAAMTANVAANTTRVAVTFAQAASGQIAINNAPEHVLGAAQNITHGSFWDAQAPGTGNPLWSAQASVAKGGTAGDIIRVSTGSLALGPLAA